MKKRLTALLFALLLCLSATSCAPDAPPADGDTPPTSDGDTQPKEAYYLLLYNSLCLSEEDTDALDRLVALYPTHDVFSLDVKDCGDAGEVYTLLKEEAATRTARLEGIQIIGTADAVPAFTIGYKITLPSGYATGDEPFPSDYFYANLSLDAQTFSDFCVADYLAGGGEIPEPTHAVVRLPLEAGELAGYLDTYTDYLADYEEPTLTAIVSPIFRDDNRYEDSASADDLAYFLTRAEGECR